MQEVSTSYICEQIIGTGGFATVYRARHLVAPLNIAMKMIDTTRFENFFEHTQLVREITILKQINHPFIAKFFFSDEQDGFCYLGQEYVQEGSLFDLVTHYGRIPEMKVRHYFLQLVCALEYLHKVCKVAHRDLKLENILIDIYGNLKIIDFGLSEYLTEGTRFTTRCGSYPYIAPEMITMGCYTHTSDIWSLGVILYSLVTGSFPFNMDDMSNIQDQIETKRIDYPSYLSFDLIDLLSKMLCRNPEQRITIDQIKSHPWFLLDQYRSMLHAINLVNEMGHDRVDTQLIQEMVGDGIDCSQLYENLETGEENQNTILYKIYLRQKQNKWMDSILNCSTHYESRARERKSLPVIRCSNVTPRSRISSYAQQAYGLVCKEAVLHDRRNAPDAILSSRRIFRPEKISIRSRVPLSPIFQFHNPPGIIDIIDKHPQ
jgi:serine/threonine protein kinase